LVVGVAEFLPKPGTAVEGPASPEAAGLRRLAHRTMKKVTDDIEREFQFNTAIAALMEFVNGLYKFEFDPRGEGPAGDAAVMREAIETLLRLLSPFAPHLAAELWRRIGHEDPLAAATWPTPDPALLHEDMMTIPVQVNGKLRGKLQVPADWTKEQVVAAARDDSKVAEWLQGKTAKNVIYVDKKLVNFVM
jgi:leucyl-tRNA synthetase